MSLGREERYQRFKEEMLKAAPVAIAIYECEKKRERVWFGKLIDILKGKMTPREILRSLTFLSDWGIIKERYGETTKGRAGRLLYIPPESKDFVRKLYEKVTKNKKQ